ncbi:MAG: DUF6058 family natural product biosynthesis protein [Paracoccaceae bacterium]
MLLNYLYTNFLEERQFAEIVGTTVEDLNAIIDAKVFPSASYVYASNGRSVSFVADFSDEQAYRFHLREHMNWFRDISQLGLDTEARARDYFLDRYTQAKRSFLSSTFGMDLQAQAPDVASQFDEGHANSTWGHFLNGVYGVCTRDGRPESVFLKQAGVMFIETMIASGPQALSQAQTDLLGRAVDFLDGIESEFAPHEAPKASRQRCIVDVKASFFDKKAA